MKANDNKKATRKATRQFDGELALSKLKCSIGGPSARNRWNGLIGVEIDE